MIYPTFEEYEKIAKKGSFGLLSSINVKQSPETFGLSAIQLVFEDGHSSPLFQTRSAINKKLNSIAVSVNKTYFYDWLKCYEETGGLCQDDED